MHILLWVDPDDVPRVEQEITATRCRYKKEGDAYVPDLPAAGPDGPATAERIYRLTEKQLHVCRTGPNGCRQNGAACRYGFPFDTNHKGTFLDTATNR